MIRQAINRDDMRVRGRWMWHRWFCLGVLACFFWGIAATIFDGAVRANAQQPGLQGVQPIFNRQLGAWPPTGTRAQQQAASAASSAAQFGVPVGPNFVLQRRFWGRRFWRPPVFGFGGVPVHGVGVWGYPSVFAPVPMAPVVVVQPQPFPVPVPMPMQQPAIGAGRGMQARAVGAPRPIIAGAGRGVGGGEDEIVNRVAALKDSNEFARSRADEIIADGDREFAEGRYRRAASRYRDAIRRAPDYPPAYFRASHARVAEGDFDLAVTRFAMGLELARTINRDGFTLDSLYRDQQQDKALHLRMLEDETLRQEDNGGIYFLLGVALHYDGNPLKARELFRKAVELPGRHRPYAAMYLPD